MDCSRRALSREHWDPRACRAHVIQLGRQQGLHPRERRHTAVSCSTVFSDIVLSAFPKNQRGAGTSVPMSFLTFIMLPLQLLFCCTTLLEWGQKACGISGSLLCFHAGYLPCVLCSAPKDGLILLGRKSAYVFIVNLAWKKADLGHGEGGAEGH